jgi:His-Xaa-Ser system protein HxsD
MKTTLKTIEVRPKLYGLEAVYKACYSFLDRVYVRLEGDPADVVRVQFRPKEGVKMSLDAISGEFENELLHQALRVKVADGNRKLREFIVTRALLSAQGVAAIPASAAAAAPAAPAAPEKAGSVLDEELEKEIEKLLAEVEKAGAGGGDPLNISVPWEEKNGAPSKAANPLKLDAVGPDMTSEAGGGCGSGCGCGSEGGHTHAHASSKKEGGDAFEV